MAVLSKQRIQNLVTAKSLTVPAGAQYAWLSAEAQDVMFQLDGSAPTATRGHRIRVAADLATVIDDEQGLRAIRVIEGAGGASLNVTYFGTA